MSSVRQVGSGLLYALISVVLVVGGLSLALAEGDFSTTASPTAQSQATNPQVPSTVLAPTATSAPSSTTVPPAAASDTPASIVVTATSPVVASPVPSLTPRATGTYRPLATAVRCGPYAGWVFTYIVQPGDTLFHISTLYRTTVNALLLANCKQSTIIVPGERLWVPNVPTITPGITTIPTFILDTPVPTEPLTETPIPDPTETLEPTAGLTGP